MVVPGANPFCVRIKIPFSEKLLDMPVKLLPPELNLTSSLFVNLRYLLFSLKRDLLTPLENPAILTRLTFLGVLQSLKGL